MGVEPCPREVGHAPLPRDLSTWEEGKAEARAEGREEGRAEALANSVLTVLRVRGIIVPEAVRTRILAQRDLQLLERWQEQAIVATSLADVLDARR
jgi:hypothetical protein